MLLSLLSLLKNMFIGVRNDVNGCTEFSNNGIPADFSAAILEEIY